MRRCRVYRWLEERYHHRRRCKNHVVVAQSHSTAPSRNHRFHHALATIYQHQRKNTMKEYYESRIFTYWVYCEGIHALEDVLCNAILGNHVQNLPGYGQVFLAAGAGETVVLCGYNAGLEFTRSSDFISPVYRADSVGSQGLPCQLTITRGQYN